MVRQPLLQDKDFCVLGIQLFLEGGRRRTILGWCCI
jgi:hypothetical protein